MAISRRAWLAGAAASVARAAVAEGVTREVFLASPKPGTAVMASAWYTRRTGGGMTSIEQHWTRSDTIDVAYYRHSRDYGRTWTAPVKQATGEKRPEGMWRRHPRAGWVDPYSGRLIEFWNEGVLPSDDPLEGLRQWSVHYKIDNGAERQVIQHGREFGPRHPLPGIWTGKTSVMIGDTSCRPLAVDRNRILVPVSLSVLDQDGKLYNPTGAYTYHDSAVLIGTWRGGRDLEWELSGPMPGDPARATRGMDEPTLAKLDDAARRAAWLQRQAARIAVVPVALLLQRQRANLVEARTLDLRKRRHVLLAQRVLTTRGPFERTAVLAGQHHA